MNYKPDVLVARWAHHELLQEVTALEDRRERAQWLENYTVDSQLLEEVRQRFKAEDDELRKTLWGRIQIKLSQIAIYPFLLLEWLFDQGGRRP